MQEALRESVSPDRLTGRFSNDFCTKENVKIFTQTFFLDDALENL